MKTLIRYSFIILTLGLFSSCAEQFREIRGSENRGNAFLAGGLTSSTATKRTDKAKSETVTPHQTVIPVEQAVTEPNAENTPNTKLNDPEIEKVENNQAHTIQFQKSSVSGKVKKAQIHSLKKMKLLKPAKFLKKAISQRENGVNDFLVTFGILGIIGSILGFLYSLFFVGLLEGIFFILTFISSIWLVASPTWENTKGLKIAATVLSVIGVLLGFISWILLFTSDWG